PEAVTPEHDVAEHAEAPESEPDQPEAVTPEHEVAEHAEAPESEPEQPEAVTPEHDVAEHAEAPASEIESQYQEKLANLGAESTDLKLVTELVEGIIKAMNKSHQQTLDKMLEMTSSVLNQQNQLLEQISKLTIQVGELAKQVNGQTHSPVANQEMSAGGVTSEIEVSDTPNTEVDNEREQLINETLKMANELTETKAINRQIRDRILEASKQPVKPSDLANVMRGALSPENNSSPELVNSYEQNILLLQQSAESLRDASYRRVDPQIKVIMHDAISSKGKVTLDEIGKNANSQGALIKGVLKDVFGNEQYRKGLHIAVAISECMRNCENPAIPPSAISTYVFTEMTGHKDNPLAEISEKIVKGEIKTSQYYDEARLILGETAFDRQMGEECAEMFNRWQEQVPEHDREVDHQAPPLNYDIPSPI
ncbi:hypothetical protein, partial [Vibrio sp. TRT 29B02]|uniref:hypothetical protein n=1 Tax=Vibrio sp. TRT 29B02 TaxID=3418508 RepID=UPI003CE8032D